VRHVVPEREQQRALEQETIGMRRLAQAVKDAFQCEAHEHLVEVRALRLGDVQQTSPDRRGDVFTHWVRLQLFRPRFAPSALGLSFILLLGQLPLKETTRWLKVWVDTESEVLESFKLRIDTPATVEMLNAPVGT